MEFVLTLLQDADPYLQWPGIAGLLAWVLVLGLLFYLFYLFRGFQPLWDPGRWGVFAALVFAALLLSLFVGFRFLLPEALTIPGQPGRLDDITWMVFAALPWVLGAGLLGPMASFILALLSGLILAVFLSHNPFTASEHAFFGLLLGVLLRQRYRTPFFRAVRRPLFAGILLSLVHPVVYAAGILLWAEEPLAAELDFAYRTALPSLLTFGGSLVAAGAIAEVAAVSNPDQWLSDGPPVPSPAERSLQTRSVVLMGLFTTLVVISLSTVGWFMAYGSALDLVESRMETSAGLAAENVPGVLEVGQNLIQTSASAPQLTGFDRDQISLALGSILDGSPYFFQLFVVDSAGDIMAQASRDGSSAGSLALPELAGVDLAVEGVPFQYYASFAPLDSRSVVSFIVPVQDSRRVLIGRSDLAENPFTSPLLTSLNSLEDIDGKGMLVDEDGLILYHPVQEMIGSPMGLDSRVSAGYSEGTSPDGGRVIFYTLPASGRSWWVRLQVPAREVQQLALQIAAPPVGLLLALAFFSIFLLWLTLSFVTRSLRMLSDEAMQIADHPGALEIPLDPGGEDEVGILRKAFETMRRSLKRRMDEQEELLKASHGVASSLEFDQAIHPLLGAARSGGAAAARVVLTAGALPQYGPGTAQAYGTGATERYDYLDSQILHLCREKQVLIIDDPSGSELLNIIGDRQAPLAVLGIALRQQDHYFGALWVAYNHPHPFEEEEVRFMSTLGGQAALAAANARLFQGAEVGRSRLAAILASTPDPVLVTDQNDDLLLSNPAAWQVVSEALENGQGAAIETLVEDPALLSLLKPSVEDTQSKDVTLPDGRVFTAKASDVIADGRPLGRICVLRDVTRFKELDDLKSDFVSTVSHDLGAPLLVIRGYATMVELVGDLTEEQARYVTKIVVGVDRMARIVDSLLQLGRIESGVDLVLEAMDPHAVLVRVRQELAPLAEEKSIALEIADPPRFVPEIEVDAEYLHRALHNLVENAIKYTPAHGRVRVSVQHISDKDEVRYAVLDNGIGISLPDQERLFEKFFRARSREARKQRGSGLGLAMVRSIAERLGGRVWVKSELGKGSAFYLTLPVGQVRSGK